ncbi:hypothetical protein PILCRDRAFT_11469 [Piloderma croceum F 1598]|uniref:Uncharacterized protein n=1 Tax=Piloderma croceum (strain F 1598) TaxID=765440 RepID=A0A0C3BKZ7_PILCF|nr:hypothetical protein PILCRDRAFT_11469 [Piloderma croceum F 1598]
MPLTRNATSTTDAANLTAFTSVSGAPHIDFRDHEDIANSADDPPNGSQGSDGEDDAGGARIPVPPLEGSLISFTNHPANLPNLYQAENHPLRKHGHARTFVYIQDTDEEGLRNSFQAGKDFVIPIAKREDVTATSGSLELFDGDELYTALFALDSAPAPVHLLSYSCARVLTLAFPHSHYRAPAPTFPYLHLLIALCLEGLLTHSHPSIHCERINGNAVFSRDMWGSGLPEHDTIQAWVVGRHLLSKDIQDRVEKVRNDAHGPDDMCGPTKAKKKKDAWAGGIAFERNKRAVAVGNTRCYTVGTSYPAAKVMSAPAKGGKWNGEWDPDLLARKEFVSTMTACATEAMMHAPDKVIENLKNNTEMCNFPRVGCPDNYYYQSVQYNVAHTERFHSGASLKKDMGSFGGKHQDLRDGPPAYSAGTSHSKLPDRYDNGCFFLCELGVHIYLTNMQVLHISGLKTHGGSVPTAPEGVIDIAEWAYHFFVICYPPGAYINGTGHSALAALPNHSPFILGPEMTNLMCVALF